MRRILTPQLKIKQPGLQPLRPRRESLALRATSVNAGYYEPTALLDRISDEELLQRLRKQDRRYQGADDFDCWEAIMRGEVAGVRLVPQPREWNSITRGYLRDTEGARLVNAHTANEDGILRYLAVGTNNTDAAYTDTGLYREIYRAVPLTKKSTDTGDKFVLKLDFEDANPDTATTIAAGTWTKTSFEVASVTGLNIGDAIQVNTSPASSRTRIASIVGNLVTVDTNQPLLYVPLEGQTVTLLIGEAGSYGNQDADSDPDTGTLFSRSPLKILKNEDLAWFIKFNFIRTPL